MTNFADLLFHGIVITYFICPKYVYAKLHFIWNDHLYIWQNNKHEIIERNKISPRLMIPKVWMRITSFLI